VIITTKEFKQFQASYLTAVSAVILCDMLASACFYHSLLFLGLNLNQIATLYVVSVFANAVFSIIFDIIDIIPSKRDKCALSAILFAMSMFSLFIGPHYEMLLFGRVIYGIAMALKDSGFENYGSQEHSNRGFPEDWQVQTAGMISHCMTLMAAVAGILGQTSSSSSPLGVVGLACTLFILLAFYIVSTWTKDVGTPRFALSSYVANVNRVLSTLKSQKSYMYYMIITCCFESTILLFTFYWAPWMMSLEPDAEHHVPFEIVFSCMILASMLGSYLFQVLAGAQNSKFQYGSVLQGVFMASSCLYFVGGSIVSSPVFAFFMALMIQVAIGFYWSSLGFLRAEIVLPELRTHTLSLNKLLTATVTLVSLHHIAMHRSSFGLLSICAMLNVVALYSHHKLIAAAAIDLVENEEFIVDNDL
jgi:hypothetical protein